MGNAKNFYRSFSKLNIVFYNEVTVCCYCTFLFGFLATFWVDYLDSKQHHTLLQNKNRYEISDKTQVVRVHKRKEWYENVKYSISLVCLPTGLVDDEDDGEDSEAADVALEEAALSIAFNLSLNFVATGAWDDVQRSKVLITGEDIGGSLQNRKRVK